MKAQRKYEQTFGFKKTKPAENNAWSLGAKEKDVRIRVTTNTKHILNNNKYNNKNNNYYMPQL